MSVTCAFQVQHHFLGNGQLQPYITDDPVTPATQYTRSIAQKPVKMAESIGVLEWTMPS
jgi:hypothetical protein